MACLWHCPPEEAAQRLDSESLSELIAWSLIDGPWWGQRDDVLNSRLVAMLAAKPEKVTLPDWDTHTPRNKVPSRVGLQMMAALFSDKAK